MHASLLFWFHVGSQFGYICQIELGGLAFYCVELYLVALAIACIALN
ncbi:hypothetical protein VCRA2121O157_50021 [Vibrio crassostreae]|nr:hypothetical protein VCRA2113O204_100066 [Vibrio crassostreae]CAK1697704.1 hypothetical protein VCRA2112O187_10340001 [Vibrio crassostreae]CAK1699222.1 hypothetical protein VCRA2113O201_100066 [Vibrio crassostreae]CAK1702564.1 hypothetical protein VCRA2113O228_100100 [Vibrio crassostreae]CAK1810866.1 hypothetical protein VCRA2110O4_180035 [Vibrio crassostreae]